MAALTASVFLRLRAVLSDAVDLSTPADRFLLEALFAIENGTGLNQGNQLWHDTRTLAISATENLDLAGGLTNGLGDTVTFARVIALYLKAAVGNTNNVLVGGAASAPWFPMFSDSSDILKIRPGGAVLLMAPDATGYAVTATSADILKVANSGAGTSVSYDIALIGSE